MIILKKILILNSFIRQFTGSEIVVLELAEYFFLLKNDVTVASFSMANPLLNEFNKRGINVISLYELEQNSHYDIIWSHHFPTIEYCILDKNISADKIIFSSLSGFTELECPPLILDKITHLLVNSIENKKVLENIGFCKDDIYLFPNPAPEAFFRRSYCLKDKLSKIAFISNHIPKELIDAKTLLENNNISVDIYGFGYNEVLITEDILCKYDAVVTIGKTVQYCLALGLPVYCYDIFGGNGWLVKEHFKQASIYNFSGRGFSIKKSGKDIFNEISKEYKKENFNFYKEEAHDNYCLNKVVSDILHKKNRIINYNKDILLYLRTRQQKVYSSLKENDAYIQLFFSNDHNFSEINSIKKGITFNGFNAFGFELNKDHIYYRLDISNFPSIILAFRLSYVCHNGNEEILLLNDKVTEQLEIDDDKIFLWGNDSKIYFEIKHKIKVINVSFYINNSDLLQERLIKGQEHYCNCKSENAILLKNNTLLSLEVSKIQKELSKMDSQLVNLEEENRSLILRVHELSESNQENLRLLAKSEYDINNIKKSKVYKMVKVLKKTKNKLYDKLNYRLILKSGLFDTNYYIESNNDVKEQGIDPIKHYMHYGWFEGRNPSRIFNTNFYTETYSDVKESGLNPLIHYIKWGKKENRKINDLGILPRKNKLGQCLDIFRLIKHNPSLVSKFIFMVKQYGISYTLLKVNNKLEKLDVSNNSEGNLLSISLPSISDILESLNKEENINKILTFYQDKKSNKKIDIIIPIYNGYEFLDKLFESLVKNTSLPYRLIIGNDKSPDKRVKDFIIDFIQKNPNIDIIFIDNNENLGFLKTVNLLSSYAENHLVILNTDTEVPKYWLERLMYPIFSNKNIASTTPFTNSGTICSFPEYLVDNSTLYRDLQLSQIDSLFAYLDVDKQMISVPTGVGFCMGMNFDVIQKIGMFDEIYGKGYGEENDWCQRAIQAGFENVHIPNLFVYHKHGGSFLSEDKKRYIEEHYRILLNKFPTYDQQVQKTIKENKFDTLRRFMKVLIDFNYTKNKNIVFIDHDLGGGANAYRKQKISEYLKEGNNIVSFTYNINIDEYHIEFITSNYNEKFKIDSESDFFNSLEFLKLDLIFLNGLVSFPDVIGMISKVISFKKKENVQMIFPIHDYFCISPNYTLLGENGKYAGVPVDLAKHALFLQNSTQEFKLFCEETDAMLWHSSWENLLNECNKILCFSHSSEDIILTAYPKLQNQLVYIPHDISGKYDNIYDDKLEKSKKIIGILGNINLAKGSGVVKELVSYIENNHLDIKIVLIGNIDCSIKSSIFSKTGSYKGDELPYIIKEHGITEFLIPSIWPETFSYTTDEIMQLGYPLSVFDLGAPAERVRNYSKGKILPLEGYLEILCK